jgi:hypothetical protein
LYSGKYINILLTREKVLEMSKLQLKKYSRMLSEMVSSIAWWRSPALSPAKREFIGIGSTDLADMVSLVVEMRYQLLLGFDRNGIEEYKPVIKESHRLIQRAMVELVRRGDLPVAQMDYLLRILGNQFSGDRFEKTS